MHKVGIIGYGKMGRIRHLEIQNSGKGKVLKIYDPNLTDPELPAVSEVDDIIQDREIDTIFICTPNYLNKPLTIKALEAGKNVFCEKPPAFTEADVIQIRKIEKKSGKVLMYGFNHRHHSSIQEIKNYISRKTFGRILWMRGRYGKSVDQSFYDNWRSKRKFAGGGILIDQGIHMLDLFLFLGGDFDNIHAAVSNRYWNLDVEDNVFVTLENSKTGLSASLHSTMTQWRHLFSLEVFLEKGYFVLNGLKTSSNSYGDEVLTIARNRSTAPAATWKDEENITYRVDHSWKAEMEEFFNAIEENRRVTTGNSTDAQRLMRIIDKIYSFRKDTESDR